MNSKYRGKTLTIKRGHRTGCSFVVIDTFDKVFEVGWRQAVKMRQPLAIEYCVQAVILNLPLMDEPLVGRILGVKILIHPVQFTEPEEKEEVVYPGGSPSGSFSDGIDGQQHPPIIPPKKEKEIKYEGKFNKLYTRSKGNKDT